MTATTWDTTIIIMISATIATEIFATKFNC
jgi:hypothetical protein